MTEEKKIEKSGKEIIAAKFKKIQEEYNDKVTKKNALVNELRSLNEEIVKLVGSYQTLQELQNEIDPEAADKAKKAAADAQAKAMEEVKAKQEEKPKEEEKK